MATTPVTLKIDGFADREVAAVTYSFERSIDKENQPAGPPRGGKILVRVKAMNDGNVELLKWMTTPNLAKKGSILFMVSSDIDKKMKSVEFEGAFCIDYVEHWEDVQADQKDAKLAHWEELTISCQKLTNGPVAYKNDWK